MVTLGANQLMAAAESGDLEQVKEVLSSGINVNVRVDLEETALMGACRAGYIQVVKALIEKGARVNDRNSFGLSPLILSAAVGHFEVAKFLIDNGADINAKDVDFHDTALMWAINENHVDIAILLINSGANLDEKNKAGQVALLRAEVKKQDEVIKALLAKGARNTEPTSAIVSQPLSSKKYGTPKMKWWQFWK